jgi:hypothetical protein
MHCMCARTFSCTQPTHALNQHIHGLTLSTALLCDDGVGRSAASNASSNHHHVVITFETGEARHRVPLTAGDCWGPLLCHSLLGTAGDPCFASQEWRKHVDLTQASKSVDLSFFSCLIRTPHRGGTEGVADKVSLLCPLLYYRSHWEKLTSTRNRANPHPLKSRSK